MGLYPLRPTLPTILHIGEQNKKYPIHKNVNAHTAVSIDVHITRLRMIFSGVLRVYQAPATTKKPVINMIAGFFIFGEILLEHKISLKFPSGDA